MSAGPYPFRGSRGECVPCSFQGLVATGIPGFVIPSVQPLPLWSPGLLFCLGPVSLCRLPVLLSYKVTVIAFRAHLENKDALFISESLIQSCVQRPLSQVRSHLQVPGFRTCYLWGALVILLQIGRWKSLGCCRTVKGLLSLVWKHCG